MLPSFVALILGLVLGFVAVLAGTSLVNVVWYIFVRKALYPPDDTLKVSFRAGVILGLLWSLSILLTPWLSPRVALLTSMAFLFIVYFILLPASVREKFNAWTMK